MKEKRKAVVVAVIVTVLVACVMAPFGPTIWKHVAYQSGHVGFEEFVGGLSIDRPVRVKRFAWIPGRPFYADVSHCHNCERDAHGWCKKTITIELEDASARASYDCQCTDDKHAEK